MKYPILAGIAVVALGSTVAFAQSPNPAAGVKLSQSECTSLWQQANTGGGKGLTASQAAPYVSNFKAANPDGDATIDQNEWMAACNKGLVKSSSSSGSSSGTSGSSTANPPSNAPTNH